MRIDRIGPDHAAQLADLQVDTFKQAYVDFHSPEDITSYCVAHYTPDLARAELSSEKTLCCVGLLDSDLSGYYIVKHQSSPIELGFESSELKQIYVLDSAYGNGLGRALYDHALKSIQSVGHRWVWLCVSDTNYRAQAFYDKHGFRRIGDGPDLKIGKDRLTSSVLALEI